MTVDGCPPVAMTGCLVDAEREGSGLVRWRLRSEPTGSYGSFSNLPSHGPTGEA